jgi:uroporphyrinogen-III synthase
VAAPAASHRPEPGAGIAPLAGYCVAVASDRRRHPLADLLERTGARTVNVQAIRSVAQPDESLLRSATERVLAGDCDEFVVSSGYGLRGWIAAARRWGLVDALVARLAPARLLARDPRAADGLRELGFSTIWSTAGAATEDLFRYLAAQPLTGRRVVVLADMASLAEPCQALRTAGADVVEVPAYRAYEPAHADLLRRLGDHVINRQVDAVALLGEPATANLLAQAKADHRMPDLLNALCDDVLCSCLGPLTAEPLAAQGVRPIVGTAPFVEELAEALAAEVPRSAVRVRVNGYRMEVRGQAVVLDDRLIPVQAGPIAVLRALARQPGRVLSCAEIRRAIPNWSTVDDHAIEMAVSRLRRSLAGTDLVQTVMKRGYRLVA